MLSLKAGNNQIQCRFRTIVLVVLTLLGLYVTITSIFVAGQVNTKDKSKSRSSANLELHKSSSDVLWGYFRGTKIALGMTGVWCDVAYETSSPLLGSSCYLRDRLTCTGMPTIHSAFVDVVSKEVVFTGITFLVDTWERETFYCEFSDGSVSASDAILNDTRSFGGQPQYVIVITCPVTASYMRFMKSNNIGGDKHPHKITLRRVSEPRYAYRNIPACNTGVHDTTNHRFLSLCTMAKGMDEFFRVWLLYYRYMGVDHVYIYDNSPETSLVKVLRPFIRIGYVTVVPWAHQYTPSKTYLEVQIAHENDCLWRHRHDTKWVIKVDVDEFMQPMDPKSPRIIDFIHNFGDIPESVATLRVRNWFFSKLPSNVSKDILYSGTVIERNPWRSPDPTEENRGRDKCLVLPQRVHYFKIHGVKIGGDTVTLNPTAEMRLVHYRSENPMHRNFRIHQFVRDDSMRNIWEQILFWKDRTADKYIRWTYKKGAPVDDVHPYKKKRSVL